MENKVISRMLILGLLSWFIPFAFSFLFFKPGGELVVPYATFKSVILSVGVLSGCFLLYPFFKVVDADFVQRGVMLGLVNHQLST